jgi:Tfp pilus assembly PilM family ATPase
MAAESSNTTKKSSYWGLRRASRPSNLQAADESGEGVGLYLSGNQAYLAAVRASKNRLPILSRHLAVDLDPNPGVATKQLREHLLAFGNGRMPRHLWTSLQSPGMVLQSLRIPRVRPAGMASAAFWTLKKERNLNTEGTVFDIELLRAVEEDGSPRLELLAVAVPKEELEDHQQFNIELGSRAAGVTPPVFAFRNFLRLGYPELNRGPCAILFVNDASSDVFVFEGGQVVAVRTLRTGLDSLRDAIAQTLDLDPTDAKVMACLDLLAGQSPDASLFGGDAMPSEEDVFGWGRPVARRLARNIQRTLHAFEETLESGAGAAPVFMVAGTVTRYERLVRFLGDQIGLTLTPFTPAKSEHLDHIRLEADPVPEESGLSLAIGLALAGVYRTPNLLFTYEDRRRQRKHNMIAKAVRVSTVVLLVVLVALTAALRYYLRTRERHRDRLRETVAIGQATFDQKALMESSRKVIARLLTTKALAKAYYAPALVSEVSTLTPDSVFLVDIQVDFAQTAVANAATAIPKTVAAKIQAKRAGRQAKDEAPQSSVVRISGIVQGEREHLGTILAQYMLRLKQSPFFVSPEALERRIEEVDPNYVQFGDRRSNHLLFFTLSAQLSGNSRDKQEGDAAE